MRTLIFLFLMLALAPASNAFAQGRGLQAKADNLYRNGHWERAYFIYVNELAVTGDKYSQYMAGYMSLHGKGVERDKIKASAWYRLAAERDDRKLVKVRDQLLETLSDAEREASDAAFLELRQRYSDLALVIAQLEKERAELRQSPTGSRLGAGSSSITVIDPQTGQAIERAEYLRRQEKRMQERLDYVAEKLGTGQLQPDMNNLEFAELSAQVAAYLQVVNDL